MILQQMQLDDFDIEYEAVTDISESGFTDQNGAKWETWNVDRPGVEFMARRDDGLTVEVTSV